MEEKSEVPFKVGQVAEAKSFLKGYRGAWFRCKILQISSKRNEIEFLLQFYDFPDEEVSWTKLYQKPNKLKGMKRELMLRPSFPRTCCQRRLSQENTDPELVAVVNDSWKVGDLVDWWTDGCFWSGRLTDALGNQKFQIHLLPPPAGEGCCYEVSATDLRPSLDWSPKHGWTPPVPTGDKSFGTCVRLIKFGKVEDTCGCHGLDRVADTAESCLDITEPSLLDCNSRGSLPGTADVHLPSSDTGSSDCFSSSNVDGCGSPEQLLEYHLLRGSDTIKDSVLELQKLLERVKCAKNILEIGFFH